MRIFALVLLMTAACVVASPSYADKLYKWVDENGVVNYSKTPPPPNARDVAQKNLGDNATPSVLPYSLQQAVKNFPLTLYATDCGKACDEARAYLKKRGVPYSEKNPQAPGELENFKKISPDLQIPVLTVGTFKTLKGFLDSDWDSALDAAGYPSAPLPGVKLPSPTTPNASAPAPAMPASPQQLQQPQSVRDETGAIPNVAPASNE